MNILFLLRLWPVYGGGETVTICLANEMVKRGHNVHILYFKQNTRQELPFIDERIQSRLLDNIACDEFYAADSDAEKAVSYLRCYIDEYKITHVINQWWPASYIKGIKEECHVKVYKCLHQAFFTPKLEAKGFKATLKRLFKYVFLRYKKWQVINRDSVFFPYVDKFIFLSPAFQKQFEEFAGYTNTGKLTSIPNPLVFERKITLEEFEKKQNVALIVARMEESQKRITAALQIWKEIEQDPRLSSWKLEIVGEGRDLPMYKTLASTLRLKRVTFEGFQNPINYYIKSKVFLMTSYNEGFPMTLVECLQSGVVPVVMDSFLSLHDIVKDDYNGIITPNADIQEYVERLSNLMNDDYKRRSLAANGIISCEEFSVANVVNKWESLFNEKV